MKTRMLLVAVLLATAFAAGAESPDLESRIDALWDDYRQMVDSGADTHSIGEQAAADLVARAVELMARAERNHDDLSAVDLKRLQEVLSRRLVAPKTEVPRGPSGSVSGTVLETGTSTPIANATIVLQDFNDFTQSFATSTDSTGNFTVNAPPGGYVLQVQSADGYVDEAYPDQTCVNSRLCSPYYGGEHIQLNAGDALTGYDFDLDPGVRITGTVTDAGANPLQGATVTLQSSNAAARVSAVTNSAGAYTTEDALPPGDFRVYVRPPSGGTMLGQLHDGQDCIDVNGCRYLPVNNVSISNTTTPQIHNFSLNDGFGVSGQVFESDGTTPLADATVTFISTDGYSQFTATTDGSGNYSVGPVRPGDYTAIAEHPARLSEIHSGMDCFDNDCDPDIGTVLTLGSSAGGPVNFTLDSGASVSGTIRRQSDGTPVQDTLVRVFSDSQGGRFTTTDSMGQYTVGGLVEGTFWVNAFPPSNEPTLQSTYRGNVTCETQFCGEFGQPLNVPAGGSVTGVDIDLPEAGVIEGQVFDQLTGEALGLSTVARVELWVASGPRAGELAAQGLVTDTTTVYSATNLKPGAYKAVFASSTHLGLIDTASNGSPCPRGACDQTVLPTVYVTAGATLTGVDQTLPRGPVISGTVRDQSSGQPIDQSPVYSDLGPLATMYSNGDNYAGFSSLDADGNYRTRTGFAPGTYFASTYATRNETPHGLGYVDEAWNNADCPRLSCNLSADATPISITGSTTGVTGIDFDLRQGGRITGTVSDQSSPDVLGGVAVEAYDAGGNLVAETVTDANGDYELSALPGGNYTVRTRNSVGFEDELYDGIGCNPSCNPVSGTAVSVTEGAATGGIDFQLSESASISGTTEVSGSPVGGVTVEVYGALGNLLSSQVSASNGSFSFTSLPAGEFYLRTRNSLGYADTLYNANDCVGDACRVRDGDSIVLTAGGSASGITLTLSPEATISGQVTDAGTMSGLSGVRVQLLDPTGAVAFEKTSGSGGSYSFGALAAGSYHLVTRETPGYVDQTFGGTPCPSACNGLNGTPISVSAGGSAGGSNLDLSPGAGISGNITTGGTPAVGAVAQIYNASGVPVAQGPTNASGNYDVSELPDGDFYVRTRNVPGYIEEVYDDNACSGYCDILSGDAITITGSTSVGSINFTLNTGGSIEGTVDRPGGAPIPLVEVVAYDLSGEIAGTATTDSSGDYSIQGLLAGSYRLRTANVGGFVDEVYGGSSCSPTPCALSAGTQVNVSGGPTSGIDFTLAAGASIAGSATDTFGNPLPGGTAVLFDADGTELSTATISDGLWSFDGLADGTYYVLIENGLGLVDELYDGVSCPGGACDISGLGTPIVIGGGMPLGVSGVNDVSVVLERGNTISGQVTDAKVGDPLVGAEVFVFDTDGKLVASGVTDGTGAWQTGGGLPDGTYYAATASGTERGVDGNFINELYPDTPCLLDCDVTQGAPISVSGGPATGIDFELAVGSGATGSVVDTNGQGLVQITVRFYDDQGVLAGSARTNSQGEFVIDGLAAGQYFAHTVNALKFEDVVYGNDPCEGSCDPLEGDPISVPADGVVEGIDFQLDVEDLVFRDRFE